LLSDFKNGAVILDVGNGGSTNNELLGQKIADSIQTFFALDSSYPMLTRNGIREGQILGDARSIPLSDNSVDYVTINNVLHHLGRHVNSEPSIKMKEVFVEASRVSRKGIIGVEILVPHIGQQAETLALQFLKFMPTFVYSEGFYRNLMNDLGVKIIEFESIFISKLVSPFKFSPPIMDLPFIQLPSFLMPYHYLFYHLSSNASD
jgi:ubiquinone/menaquinone biosynthesis C-methylase UbiE